MATIEKRTSMTIKEIKEVLKKAVKWEDDVLVQVKVYDCDESGEQTYDVEIIYYINGEYVDTFVNDTFYGIIDNEVINKEAEKQATKRAKAVLRTVKGWFAMNDQVTVIDTVEVYHA